MTDTAEPRWADRPRPCRYCNRLAMALDQQGRPAHAGCAARAAKQAATANQESNR